MAEEKFRLGGMALANGVLVHGPTSWACAVRTGPGTLKVASGRKPRIGVSSDTPLLRGPARLLEAMALIPQLKRAQPKAKLPMQNGSVVASMAGAALGVKAILHTLFRH